MSAWPSMAATDFASCFATARGVKPSIGANELPKQTSQLPPAILAGGPEGSVVGIVCVLYSRAHARIKHHSHGIVVFLVDGAEENRTDFMIGVDYGLQIRRIASRCSRPPWSRYGRNTGPN